MLSKRFKRREWKKNAMSHFKTRTTSSVQQHICARILRRKKSVGIRVAFTWWSKKKRAKRDSKVLVRKCSVLTNRHEKKKCPSRKKIMLWKGCVVVIFFSRLHRWNEINISLLASFYQLTKRTFFRMLVAAQQFKYNQPKENVWRTRPIIYRILDIFHGKSRRNIKF